MAIRIITDSMCDVPKEYVEKYDIGVMALTVHFGEQSYKDGIDITQEEFHKKLSVAEQLPTTSQVPPMEFYNAFKDETIRGNQVIAIMGSAKMSGTYNSAVLAMSEMSSKDIRVIDSAGITLGAGMLVIKAARLAEQGMGLDEIVDEIEKSKLQMKHFFILDTLKYLQKGGRISLSASVLGSILNIKPILTVIDGKLELLDKTRGIKKAIDFVIEHIKENNWTLDGKTIGINHIVDPEHMVMLEEAIKAQFNPKEIIRGEVGSVVSTHGGPGAVAFYFEDKI